MLNQRRFVIGAALIAAAVSYLVYAGIRSTSVYYFEIAEFLPRRAAHEGDRDEWQPALHSQPSASNPGPFPGPGFGAGRPGSLGGPPAGIDGSGRKLGHMLSSLRSVHSGT